MRAVLVINEMPENCNMCPLEYYSDVAGIVCGALSGPDSCICEMWEDKDKQGRLSDCPLRELEENLK